ncbi:hypothetical protein [Noviherbaspirillum galbum]|uniref:Uncharacterized protein n=1 Tax=Noviherbaspirillum galbum TaxID=2709383 RepID=A0A6B3SNM7_9BURK|nr:hypothetical protein [Noviherbaspirillum galbum]NEX60052.1 hypothetical protein [Noviherbaspirillum galbum]
MYQELYKNILGRAIDLGTRYVEKKLFANGAEAGSTAPVPSAQVERVLQEAMEQLAMISKASTDAIIAKIENDKLEELRSRIQSLGFLLKIEKKDEAFRYMLTLKESVDYALNRVNEGKTEWLSPCILGKSVFIATLEYCAVSADTERVELSRICKEAKHTLLNVIVPQILSNGGQVPWDQVEAFLVGTSNSLLELQVDEVPAANVATSTPAGKTVLAPSGGWPFPT